MLFRFAALSLPVWSILIVPNHGFVQEFLAKVAQPPMLPKTELDDSTNALVSGVPLDISLQLGKKGESILSVQRLTVNLASDVLDSPPPTAPMPDQKAYQAHLLQNGHFIDRQGLKTLDLADPCWQLIWRDQSPAGNCVIGLDVQSPATRNEATLEKGSLFVSFPVWKQDRLVEMQTRKAECELAAMVHLQERDAEIEKLKAANNILVKAWHYRNAAAAVEK